MNPPNEARDGEEPNWTEDEWLRQAADAIAPSRLGRLGHYDVLCEVGCSGQSVVYEAIEINSRKRVALKRLRQSEWASPAMRVRLANELRWMSSLDHPGIRTAHDLEVVDGVPVLAMDWIDGVNARVWARRGAGRSLQDIARVGEGLADALHHAHQRGVMHRDLKPENILVDAEDQPHILDFGLARPIPAFGDDSSADFGASIEGRYVGTPAYSSPEQVQGVPGSVDVRSDLYSLGVILYEMATGTLPYELDGKIARTLYAVAYEEPLRPPRDLVDSSFSAILNKLLQKCPEDRYPSADALRRDLMRYLAGDPLEARPETKVEEMLRFGRRHAWGVGITASLLLLLTGVAITMTVLFQRAERTAHTAQRVQEFLASTLAPTSTAPNEVSLLDLMEAASARLSTELKDEPAAMASLHLTLAHAYKRLWMWPEAEKHAESAVETYRSIGQRQSKEMLSAHLVWGVALSFLSDPRSIAVQEETVALCMRLYGGDSIAAISSKGALAYALWRTGSHEQRQRADLLYGEVLNHCGRSAELPKRECAAHLHSYAAFLWQEGRREESVNRYEEALQLYRDDPVENSVNIFTCLLGLGRSLISMGEHERGQLLLKEGLQRLPEGMAPGPASSAYRTLAESAEAQGDPEATDNYWRALREVASSVASSSKGVWPGEHQVDAWGESGVQVQQVEFLYEGCRAYAPEMISEVQETCLGLERCLRNNNDYDRATALSQLTARMGDVHEAIVKQ